MRPSLIPWLGVGTIGCGIRQMTFLLLGICWLLLALFWPFLLTWGEEGWILLVALVVATVFLAITSRPPRGRGVTGSRRRGERKSARRR